MRATYTRGFADRRIAGLSFVRTVRVNEVNRTHRSIAGVAVLLMSMSVAVPLSAQSGSSTTSTTSSGGSTTSSVLNVTTTTLIRRAPVNPGTLRQTTVEPSMSTAPGSALYVMMSTLWHDILTNDWRQADTMLFPESPMRN